MGRDLTGLTETFKLLFQSTRPHGARPAVGDRWRGPRCFNPRARMGRDNRRAYFGSECIVSIHAPAWGATGGSAGLPDPARFNPRARMGRDNNRYPDIRLGIVSIHAPAWGATVAGSGLIKLHPFQSTRPHGARLFDFVNERPLDRVSIHAPAWGATITAASSSHPYMFQSTRPHGARHLLFFV